MLPAALLLFLLLAGCLVADGGPRRAIVPLAVGNAWDYVHHAHYGEDSVVADSSRTAVTGTRTVTVNGRRRTVHLARGVDRTTGRESALAVYLENRADGNYTIGATQDSAEYLLVSLHVKHPARAGDRYPTYFLSFREQDGALVPVVDTVEIEVAAVDTTCTVPAGTFPCLRYRGWRAGGVLHATGYYAPGIGNLGADVVRLLEVDGAPREVLFTRRLSAYSLH